MVDFYGGVLCLDFANSLDGRRLDPPKESLFAYVDLARWAQRAGITDEETLERLLDRAGGDPEESRVAFAAAITLREAIFRTFDAIACGNRPAAVDLASLHDAYAAAVSEARLVWADTQSTWTWENDHPSRAWWPVAHSAVQLLTSGPVDRVKLCASQEGCAGLFLDTSKNRSRRWCSMSSCGAELKTRRQSARRRAARTRM